MIKKSLLVWLSIVPLAILNGGIRDKILVNQLGNFAMPASGILLCLMFFVVSYIFLPLAGEGSEKTYLKIGLIWLALTILFETSMGLVMGHSICKILKSYDVTTGNLWLLVLISIGIAPWLTMKVRKR